MCIVLSLSSFILYKSINANYLINEASYQKKLFTASSCSWMQPKYGSTSLCDQNCGLQTGDRHTDRQTQGWTDKSLKTEGPMILSNDIFYFKTVIIGGPIVECKQRHTNDKKSSNPLPHNTEKSVTLVYSKTLTHPKNFLSNFMFQWRHFRSM